MPERHVIRTVSDLYALITEDNFEEMADNLREWVEVVVVAKASGLPFTCDQIVWVDDGKHGVSNVTISVSAPVEAAGGDTEGAGS